MSRKLKKSDDFRNRSHNRDGDRSRNDFFGKEKFLRISGLLPCGKKYVQFIIGNH